MSLYFNPNLYYYKQGEDLATSLEFANGNLVQALIAHSEILESSAENLRLLAGKALEHDIKVEIVDNHFILLSSSEEAVVHAMERDNIVTIDTYYENQLDEEE